MNVVVLQGVLSRPASWRELPSGDGVMTYEVTTRDDDGVARTVPVAWPGGPPDAQFDQGEGVVVTGAVQRRYFRAGGVTQSRTEVVAVGVARAGDRRRVRRLLAAARRALDL